MSVKKFRKKSEKELREALKKAQEELEEIVFNLKSGREQDYAQVKFKKKEIARIKTILKEKDEED